MKLKIISAIALLCAVIQSTASDNENSWGSGSREANDNRKPQIRNCKGYAPVIKEEQQHGTFVTKLSIPTSKIESSSASSPRTMSGQSSRSTRKVE
jgi:hypothetical protein